MDADQRESAVRSEPRAPACDPPQLLRRLISGYQATFLIQVAAELNLADLLADGPRGAEELATAAGDDPNALRRVLFALAQIGVFARRPDGRFELTPLGACLRSGHPDRLNAFARYQAHAVIQQPWSSLLHSVRTGETAFDAVFGASLFDYLASRPDVAALFTSGMAARTAEHLSAIVAAYDWKNFETIADVGGADGTLLASILAAAPNARGITFDQHRVRDAAERRIASGTQPSGASRPRDCKDVARSPAATFSRPFRPARTPICSSIFCTTGRTTRRSPSCATCAAPRPPTPACW